MKKIFTILGLLTLAMALPVSYASAEGTMILILKDSTQKEGYLRSPFYSTIRYVDMSSDATGPTERYALSDIDHIISIGTDGSRIKFVKEIRYRMLKSHNEEKVQKGHYRTPVLFREDYRGRDSIALLVESRETMMTTGLKTAPQKEHWYYVRMQGEPALRVIGVTMAGEKQESQERNFKMYSRRTFKKYPELVKRIENNEFSIKDPIQLVKAYEQIVANQ